MTRDEAVLEFAPIFAQKVDDEWPVADQIAPIDFYGSLTEVQKNWERLRDLPYNDVNAIEPKIYYSVCETQTHFFIVYAVYHVLDWWKRVAPDNLYDLIRERFDEHLHDMEGALFVVTKEHDPVRVDAVVTIAHNNFYLYTNNWTEEGDEKFLRIVKFNETVDGQIWRDDNERVKLYIECKGHGMYGDWKKWGGGDAIWYYYPDHVNLPDIQMETFEINGEPLERVIFKKYQLEDIFTNDRLWALRFDDNVFKQNKSGKWGFVYFDEDKEKTLGGSANPPWSWNDHNDTSPIGEIATDPARFICRYAQGLGPVSPQYLYNPYLSI
jgi:hypothetical protein